GRSRSTATARSAEHNRPAPRVVAPALRAVAVVCDRPEYGPITNDRAFRLLKRSSEIDYSFAVSVAEAASRDLTHTFGLRVCQSVACSYAWPTTSTVDSSKGRPAICRPIGRPSRLKPQGR